MGRTSEAADVSVTVNCTVAVPSSVSVAGDPETAHVTLFAGDLAEHTNGAGVVVERGQRHIEGSRLPPGKRGRGFVEGCGKVTHL